MKARAETTRCTRPYGLTVVEMVVVIAILGLLFGAVVVTSRQVASSRAQAAARQQLALISAAIDQYVATWPRWTVAGVVIADKGWPDPFPVRLFAASPNGPYDTVAGFNDYLDFDRNNMNHIRNSSACLAYALAAPTGRGPFIRDSLEVNAQLMSRVQVGSANPWYPTNIGGRKEREVIVDPWGTPIRYFWVYRDHEAAASRANRGLLPVNYGPLLAGTTPGGIGHADYFQVVGSDSFPKVAVGYVLESAGPDRKFGDTWKANPSGQELSEASDNISVTP